MESYLVVALILIGLGIASLVGEFVAPTGGFFVVIAVAAFVAGVGWILLNGTRTEAAVALAGLAIGIPAIIYVAITAYRQLALKSALDTPADLAALGLADSNLTLLKGRTGKAVSALRPAGFVLIDERRLDALSDAGMIDADTEVVCVGVRGGALVVRPADRTQPFSDLSLDDLN